MVSLHNHLAFYYFALFCIFSVNEDHFFIAADLPVC
jgi:hypothetical protein